MFGRLSAKAMLVAGFAAMVFFGIGLIGLAVATLLAEKFGVAGGYLIAGGILLLIPILWIIILSASRPRKNAKKKRFHDRDFHRPGARDALGRGGGCGTGGDRQPVFSTATKPKNDRRPRAQGTFCGPPVFSSLVRRKVMLGWALTFLILALVAGYMGFFGLAGLAATIAKLLLIVFVILLIVSAFSGALRGRPPI